METLQSLEKTDIQLIKDSWGQLQKNKLQVRNTFYSEIFEEEPKARELFRESFLSWDSLPDSFEFMFKHMDNLENVILEIKRLGLKHKTFNVKPKHFPIGKKSLTKTLKRHLGDSYSDEVGSAWLKLFDYMAHYMILGMKKK